MIYSGLQQRRLCELSFLYASLLCLSFLVSSGCSMASGEEESRKPSESMSQIFGNGKVSISTDRAKYWAEAETTKYRRTYGFELVAALENGSDSTIYLPRCDVEDENPIYFISSVSEGAEEPAYGKPWACPANKNPIVVRPGEKRHDTLRIPGPSFEATSEEKPHRKSKLYLKYNGSSCPPHSDRPGCSIPDSLIRSNVFEVRAEAK